MLFVLRANERSTLVQHVYILKLHEDAINIVIINKDQTSSIDSIIILDFIKNVNSVF